MADFVTRHGGTAFALEGCWLAPLTDAKRAEIQRHVDAQEHPDDPTAYLDAWFERFARGE